MAPRSTFDVGALRRALDARDAEAAAALYADDAEMVLVDNTRPPSNPMVVRGRDAILEHFRDVFGRDLSHDVDLTAETPDVVAFRTACRYGDGTRVLAMSMAELRDGLVARETVVQAWDS